MGQANPARPTRRRRCSAFEPLEPRLPMTGQLQAVSGDWTSAGFDQLGLYDPATQSVYLRYTNTSGPADAVLPVALNQGDRLVAGDFNGDGQATLGIWQAAQRRFLLSDDNQSFTQLVQFSVSGAPLVGDWDGDGRDTVGVYDTAAGRLHVNHSLPTQAADEVFRLWKSKRAVPVAGDWDGDGQDTVGLYSGKSGRFKFNNDLTSRKASRTRVFGKSDAGGVPLAGDWNEDSRDTLALFFPEENRFELKQSNHKKAAVTTVIFALQTATTGSSQSGTTLLSGNQVIVNAAHCDPFITEADVYQLLDRAAVASASEDAIIAIVDRNGRILGVRVEADVLTTITDTETLVFAIDGAVAKARAAAFFANNTAPLTSRTVRFISQSTITQREVESNPNLGDLASPLQGPGFVAPVGLGGHFPPGIMHTPHVDLFGIEHTNRDSLLQPGPDGIKGTLDDLALASRFNVDPAYIPAGKELFAPESYGYQSGLFVEAQARGIATLPGGIPLFKDGLLVGGIGVFFPGPDGFATHEQGFVPGVGQTEAQRTNAPRVLEAEWIAFAAAGGSSQAKAPVGTLAGVLPVDCYDLPFGQITLAGVLLEIYGPHPSGVKTLLQVGAQVGIGANTGMNMPVALGDDALDGLPVPDGWLVTPHAGASLSAAEVEAIILQGILEAEKTRAQIRLQPNGQPGARASMVFAVADTNGEVLGLYRMSDATYFSIDVAVAKARNVAYYADPAALVLADRVDDNRDGLPDLPTGLAFTNRTFRFLAEPRYPSGVDGSLSGAFSSLRDVGIDPATAENLGPALPASAYDAAATSVFLFDAFHPGRNFRDPDDLANQNGVVFFPGSMPLYKSSVLVGGLGVSGDGVDQDDWVTAAGSLGFQPPSNLQADRYRVRQVRLPFLNFPRNPRA